ncbi:hypothetical protein XA26_06070 [Mycolicibacterium fortuitum]|uniref:Uncharacterized protein n=1 Tax=Mycolicibacterium fortuitum TaxID=1766 RepID=A0A0N9Y4Q8_MYCFO|nr:hypothetical protein XA26_06070 [Mycolicibacterium fortuitum]
MNKHSGLKFWVVLVVLPWGGLAFALAAHLLMPELTFVMVNVR